MPVSPQDFELYSRMTGTPMPMDASQRMQMAPAVYDFTRNFARKPNILEKTGNLVKNIGKTIGTGMAVAAAAPAYVEQQQEPKPVEQQQTTADNYNQKQKGLENQTGGAQIFKSGTQVTELNDNDTIAENLSKTQDLAPALPGTAPTDTPLLMAGFDATPKKSEEQILSEMKQYEEQAGLNKIGGPANISDKVQEFLKQDKLNPVLLAAMQNRGQEEELIATDFPIASQLSDNPQMPGGEETRALSREFSRETEPIDAGIPTNVDPSTLTPEVRNVLSTLAKGAATIPLEKQIRIAQDIVDKRSPNEVFGFASKDADTLKALQGGAGIPQQEREAARKRLVNKAAQKRADLGIDAPSTMKKVEDLQSRIMPSKPSSFVESMSLDTSPNKVPTATFNLYQKDGGTQPYSVELSSPMAVSLNEMVEDESLQEESFGKLFNLAKKSIKDKSGMAFGIDQ
tara:strand:- start:798 stop:2165 length:1368 start_codon:yes stop_codon:yes gene_type:complete